MFNKNLLAIATGAALLVGAQGASALTASAGTANYDITLQPSCTASAQGASFGTHAVDATQLQAVNAGQVQVTCSNGAPYRIMFDGGINGDGIQARKMGDGAGHLMNYALFDPTNPTAEVGDGNPLDATYLPVFQAYSAFAGIDGTGTGSAVTHPLIADVFIGSAGGFAGHYTDSVGVTVTY